jgi:hypothetical protein
MDIQEACEAAVIGARVLMCYDSEDEMVNDMIQAQHITGSQFEINTQGRYDFDGGGSIRFLTIRLNTSEHWGDIHFQEGNALAREIFPGCFTDEW